MKWVKDTSRYATGVILILGKWPIGNAYYDGCITKGDPLKYSATCRLPGIKTYLGSYATEEEAKSRVEGAVTHWIGEAGLTVLSEYAGLR